MAKLKCLNVQIALAKRVIVFAKFTTGVFHSIRGNFSILYSAGIKIRQLFSFFKNLMFGHETAQKVPFVDFQDRVLFGEQLEISSRESSN